MVEQVMYLVMRKSCLVRPLIKLCDLVELELVQNIGMAAKYSRQASIRATSASTPTTAKSFGRQFSHQQSAQTIDKSDDEEV